MLYEHWEGVDADGTPNDLFLPADSPKHAELTVGLTLVWSVEAPSRDEAMARYHDPMGWDRYKPIEE
jgi:hypothetical protein